MFASKREKKQKMLGLHRSIKRKYIKRERDSPDSKSYKISTTTRKSIKSSPRISLRKSPRKLKKEDENGDSNLKSEPSDSERILRSKVKSELLGSECSLSDTDSNSKLSVNSSSHQSQAALYKRNYLFKGVIKERVCQICQKPNGVVKCKGQCNGYFHVVCCKKIKTDSVTQVAESKDCITEGRFFDVLFFITVCFF